MLSSYGQAHLQLFTEHEQPSRASLWGLYQAPDLTVWEEKGQSGRRVLRAHLPARKVSGSPGHAGDASSSKQRRNCGQDQE